MVGGVDRPPFLLYSIYIRNNQMRNYSDLTSKEISLICDYLRNPSFSATQDKERRKILYGLDIVKQTKTNTTNDKYLSGPLGEAIVTLYFDKLDKLYIPHPPQVTYNIDKEEGEVIIRPDGLYGINVWVESKMRAYHSVGTAHSKIHGVPEKYCHLGGQLMLFLLADDEHKYNRRWYKLRRGELEPKNLCEKYHILGDLEVLHSIVLGTEVADILES